LFPRWLGETVERLATRTPNLEITQACGQFSERTAREWPRCAKKKARVTGLLMVAGVQVNQLIFGRSKLIFGQRLVNQ
jgi:hypothetical protein